MKVVLSENQLKKLILETKKEEFNRTSFYLDYYKNLTPSNFDIAKKGNEIIITKMKTIKKLLKSYWDLLLDGYKPHKL